MSEDLISKQTAIHTIMGQPPEPHYPSWYAEQIKALPPVIPKGWIPCDKKMPENEATVLVTVDRPSDAPKVLEMSYSDGRWYRNDMLVSPWWVVVAWRPMPKPYFEGVLCGWAFEKEWEEQNGSKVQ